MVLVALGVLVTSVVFLSYHVPPSSWLRILRQLLGDSSSSSSSSSGDTSDPRKLPGGERVRQNKAAPARSGNTITAKRSLPAPESTSTNAGRTIPAVPTVAMMGDTRPDEEEDEEDDGQATPKASAVRTGQSVDVPTLSLVADEEEGAVVGRSVEATKSATTTTPRMNGASTTTTSKRSPSASSLMPPPPVRASSLRQLPRANGSPSSSSSSLMPPPSSSASALRVPARQSSARPNSIAASGRNPYSSSSSLTAASTSTLPPNKRASRKVILPPGHSPLDWAALCRDPKSAGVLRGADVPAGGRLLKVSPAQMRQRNGRKGREAWGTYQGKVYNLTPYADFHPGGPGELVKGAGRAGETERLFRETHPWVNWDGMLGECLIGVLVGEGEGDGEGGGRNNAQGLDLEAVD